MQRISKRLPSLSRHLRAHRLEGAVRGVAQGGDAAVPHPAVDGAVRDRRLRHEQRRGGDEGLARAARRQLGHVRLALCGGRRGARGRRVGRGRGRQRVVPLGITGRRTAHPGLLRPTLTQLLYFCCAGLHVGHKVRGCGVFVGTALVCVGVVEGGGAGLAAVDDALVDRARRRRGHGVLVLLHKVVAPEAAVGHQALRAVARGVVVRAVRRLDDV
mmetsp:Transcript_11727/g.36421  ORF Transcript_11727/g.36421 Transcript_11727/m.36421 type:complete len:215 (+) Transcript_11727:93-737(+)